MIPGTVERLAKALAATRQASGFPDLAGTEITTEIRKRSRDVLASAAEHALYADENDRVTIDAVKLLLELRAQLCAPGDRTL